MTKPTTTTTTTTTSHPTRMSIRLPPRLYAALRQRAEAMAVPMSVLIRLTLASVLWPGRTTESE